MPYVVSFNEVNKEQVPQVGGKVASLGELLRAGIRVPPGFAVTTEAYKSFILHSGIQSELTQYLAEISQADSKSLNEASGKIRSLFESTTLPSEVRIQVCNAYDTLSRECGVNNIAVAVRSSATAEDMPTASFAGQQETFLWVRGADNVCESVRRCWASLFTPRAMSYRLKVGISHEKAHMAVGIQKMVRAKCSGVMFTLDPATGDPSQVVIEGSWGLGEFVVQGKVTPDRFYVDKVVMEISKRAVSSHKDIALVYNPQAEGVCEEVVPSDKRDAPCLTNDEVLELARLGKVIEEYYGSPQDIEWAIDTDIDFPRNIFILQSRPETVWSQRQAEPIYGRNVSLVDLLSESMLKKR